MFGEPWEVEEREWDVDMIMTQSACELPPLPRIYGHLIASGRGKVSFLQCSDTVYISHSTGQAPCSEVVRQQKPDSIFCFAFFFFK